MKYFSVRYSVKGECSISAESHIAAKEKIKELIDICTLNSQNQEITVSVEYIAEMFKRCPKCNSKLSVFDAQQQKAFYILFDNTRDTENPITKEIYTEEHDIVRCSNLICGYRLPI